MTQRNKDQLDKRCLLPADLLPAPMRVGPRSKSDGAGAKPAGPFVKFPVEAIYRIGAAKYAGTAKLYPLLLHLSWKADHRPFKLPNDALKRLRISRERKGPVLRELEQMGLIRLRLEPRKAPLITVVALSTEGPTE